MSWGRLDDGFHDHPKVDSLFDGEHAAEAIATWTLARSWCNKQLTDGFVPTGRADRFGFPSGVAELVRVGLWHEVEGGYQFHDWADYNHTRAEVEAKRRKNAEKLQKWRARKAAKSVTKDVTGYEPDCNPAPIPDPTHTQLTNTSTSDEVRHVFDEWVRLTGKNPKKARLNQKRRRKIQARLNEGYSAGDLVSAIANRVHDPWLMGEHPDSPGYDDIVTLLRDGAQVERLRDLGQAPKSRESELRTRLADLKAKLDAAQNACDHDRADSIKRDMDKVRAQIREAREPSRRAG